LSSIVRKKRRKYVKSTVKITNIKFDEITLYDIKVKGKGCYKDKYVLKYSPLGNWTCPNEECARLEKLDDDGNYRIIIQNRSFDIDICQIEKLEALLRVRSYVEGPEKFSLLDTTEEYL
jgi:hypothetical protein